MPSNTTPSRPLRRTTARLSRPLRTDHDIDHTDNVDNDKENISSSSKPSPSPQPPPPTRRTTRTKARSTSMPEETFKQKPCWRAPSDNGHDSETDSQYSSSKSSDVAKAKGKGKDEAANTRAPWRHADELEYLRPHDWSEDKIISKLRSLVFTIPAPVTGKQPFIQLTLYQHGDFDQPHNIRVPRGYRVPLMFVAKFQWASLKLVLTSAQRDKEWSDYKFDILHLSRLCERFFNEAEQACNKGIIDATKSTPSDPTAMSRKWRCPTFDRALARYNKNWLISREEFLRDFYREFENEEYEKDVLKIDWSRWALRGHKGFKLTQDELRAGIDGRMITRGLKKTEQGNWVWVDEYVIKQEEVAAVIVPPAEPVSIAEDLPIIQPTQNDVAVMDITPDNPEPTQVVGEETLPEEPVVPESVVPELEKESTPISQDTPQKSPSPVPMVEDTDTNPQDPIPPVEIPARSRPVSIDDSNAPEVSYDAQPHKSPSPSPPVESITVEELEREPTPSVPEIVIPQDDDLDADFDDIILYAEEEDTKEHIVIRSFTPTSIDSTPAHSPVAQIVPLSREPTEPTTTTDTVPTPRLSVTPTHTSKSKSRTPPPHDSHQNGVSHSPPSPTQGIDVDMDCAMSTPVSASPAKLPTKSPSPVPQKTEKAATINGDNRIRPTWSPAIFAPPRPPSPARSESPDEIPGLGGLSSHPMIIPSSPPPFFPITPKPEPETVLFPPSPSPPPLPPPCSAPFPTPSAPSPDVPDWSRRSAVLGFRSGGFLGPFRSGGFITLDDELPTSSLGGSVESSPKPTSRVSAEKEVVVPAIQNGNDVQVEPEPESVVVTETREEEKEPSPEVEKVVPETQVHVVEEIDDNDSDMDFGTPVTSPVIIVPCGKIEEIDPLPPPPSPPSALQQLSIQDPTWQSQNEEINISIPMTQPATDNQDQNQREESHSETITPGSPMRMSDSDLNIDGDDQSQGTLNAIIDSTPKASSVAVPDIAQPVPFSLEPVQPLSLSSDASKQTPISEACYVTKPISTTQQFSTILPYAMSNSSSSAPVSTEPSRSPTPPCLIPVTNFRSEQPRHTVANPVLPDANSTPSRNSNVNMPPPQNTPTHFQNSFTGLPIPNAQSQSQPQSPYHSTPRQDGPSISTTFPHQNRTLPNSNSLETSERSINIRRSLSHDDGSRSHRSESQPRSIYTNHSSGSVLSRKRQREEDTDEDEDDERINGRGRIRDRGRSIRNRDDEGSGSGVVVRKVVSMVRDTLTGLNDLLELAAERDLIPSDKGGRGGRGGKGKGRALGVNMSMGSMGMGMDVDVDVTSPSYDNTSFSSIGTQPTSPSYSSFVQTPPPIRPDSSMVSSSMMTTTSRTTTNNADSSDISVLQEEMRSMRMDLVQLKEQRNKEKEREIPINPEVRAMRQELEMMREQVRNLQEKSKKTNMVVEGEDNLNSSSNEEVRLMRDEMAALRNEMRLLHQNANANSSSMSRRSSMVTNSVPSTASSNVSVRFNTQPNSATVHPLAHLITAESDSPLPPPPTASSISTSQEQEDNHNHYVQKKHYEEALIGDLPLPPKSKRKARAILARS